MMSRKKLVRYKSGVGTSGPHSKNPGSVMILVLLALVILGVTGTGLLSLGLNSRIFAVRTGSELSARSAADAGLTKAVFEMNEKLKIVPWNDSNLPQATNELLPNCDATISYTVLGDLISGYRVECIGSSGQAERKASCTLRLGGQFDNAISAQSGIVLDNYSVVDANGSGVCTDPNGSGVTISGHSTINDGDIRSEQMDLTAVLPPTGEEFELSQGAITEPITINQSGRYDYIDLITGETLTISGDVTLYVTGNIGINQSSGLEILAGSSLTLYVGGDLTARNSSYFTNEAQDSRKCLIFGLGSEQTFTLDNNISFCGIIYAPGANVYLNNSADVYGAIAADTVEMANHSELVYDSSLSDALVTDVGVKFKVDRWWEE